MEAGALPPRWDAYPRRLPSSLDDLRGPAAGEVQLPLHVAWSGRRVYDVGQEDQRLVLYALLLAEAQREASSAPILLDINVGGYPSSPVSGGTDGGAPGGGSASAGSSRPGGGSPPGGSAPGGGRLS